jgi:hypothetical protein
LPSGDQRGYRSATPEVRVTLIAAPCSAGSVTTSPRASNATRLPVGDTDAARPPSSAFSSRARPSSGSVTTRIGTSEPSRREAQEVDPAAFLEDDRVGADRGKRDVEVVELRDLARRAGAQILAQMLLRCSGPRSEMK